MRRKQNILAEGMLMLADGTKLPVTDCDTCIIRPDHGRKFSVRLAMAGRKPESFHAIRIFADKGSPGFLTFVIDEGLHRAFRMSQIKTCRIRTKRARMAPWPY